MDKRYRAKVIPLKEGKRQIDKVTWGYTHAASIAQASHNLMRRYPYPKYFVEEPVEDPVRENPGNPGPFSKSHGQVKDELFSLELDVMTKAPVGDEEFMQSILLRHRISVDNTLGFALACDIKGMLDSYIFTKGLEKFFTGYPYRPTGLEKRFDSIEKLVKASIAEILNENCSCEVNLGPPEGI